MLCVRQSPKTLICCGASVAAGGVAARHLAPERVERVAVIGTGAQARYQVEALAEVRPGFSAVRVWGRNPTHAQQAVEDLQTLLGDDCAVKYLGSPREAVEGADVVITCTAAREPLVEAAWLASGAHVTAVGSDGKPMASAMVMLMPTMKEAMLLMPGGSSRTNKDGQFTLNGVTPGESSLQVQSMGAVFTAAGNAMTLAFSSNERGEAAPAAAAQEREFAVANVNVSGEDINGMVVVGTRGAKAIGTISYEGGMKPDVARATVAKAFQALKDAGVAGPVRVPWGK